MKKLNASLNISALVFGAVLVLAPTLAFGDDATDAALHSQVSNKVQSDHAADMKSGKIAGYHASGGGGGQASISSAQTLSAAAGGTSGTKVQPTQVKQAQTKKTPAPVTTKK